MANLLMILTIIRTWKYVFFDDNKILMHYSWYFYYVPVIISTLFVFFTVLHVGLPYNETIDKKWKLMYLPAAAFIAIVMTNDLHQTVFIFNNNQIFSDSYTYGPVFFIMVLWLFFMFVASFAIVVKRCMVPENRKKIWMAVLPFAGFMVYLAFITVFPKSQLYTMPEINCILFPAIVETLILAGLIPSNDNYIDLWDAATISVGAMDLSNTIRFTSGGPASKKVKPAQIREATTHPILVNGGTMELKSRPINGGYGYWLRNAVEINELNRKLEDMGDVLLEKNSILKAENELEEKKLEVRRQNELYDRVAQRFSKQIEIIRNILSDKEQSDEDFERHMKYLSILCSYIKRYSNLLLINNDNIIPSKEIQLAIAESLYYVNLYGVHAYAEYSVKGDFPLSSVLVFYEFLEDIFEEDIVYMNTIFLKMKGKDGNLNISIEMDISEEHVFPEKLLKELSDISGKIETKREDSTTFISMEFPSGGAEV